MDIDTILKSQKFRIAMIFIGCFVILGVVFAAGIFVGFEKAKFSFSWGENYYRNIIGGPAKPGPAMAAKAIGMPGALVNARGTEGDIIKIDGDNLTIKDQQGMESAVMLDPKTIIRRDQDQLTPDELKVDDAVVVLGEPNDHGQIQAKFIRVLKTLFTP